MNPRTNAPGKANVTPVTPLDAQHAPQPTNGALGGEEVRKAEEIAQLEDSTLPSSAVSPSSDITNMPDKANATPVMPGDAEHAGQPTNGAVGREKVIKAEEIAQLEDSTLPSSAVSLPSDIEATLDGILSDQSFDDEDVSYDVEQLVMGRPSKVMPFRIHPSLFRDVTLYVRHGVQKEYYVVARNMEKLIDGASRYTVFFGVHKDGSKFLWPILATSSDNYSRSGRLIAIKAMHEWARLVADRTKGTYIGRFFGGKLAKVQPEWGQQTTFTRLLAQAVGEDGIITSKDHPVYRELWQE